MDAISKLIESKIGTGNIKMTLKNGEVMEGEFVLTQDFKQLVADRLYRFLPKKNARKNYLYKKRYGRNYDLRLTIIIHYSEISKLEFRPRIKVINVYRLFPYEKWA